nr:LysR substrate-binding domain-containing protein [Rhizobium grahamii]
MRILSEVDLTTELTRARRWEEHPPDQNRLDLSGHHGHAADLPCKDRPKFPDVRIHIASGNTSDIIRGLESGQLNLGFIRPVENIGSLRFFSIAHERYHLAVARTHPLAGKEEIAIDDLSNEKIIVFKRQNQSFTERYFQEKFEEHGVTANPILATTPIHWCR